MSVRTTSAALAAAFATGAVAFLAGCGVGSQGSTSALPARSDVAEQFLKTLSVGLRMPAARPGAAKSPKEIAVASDGYIQAVEILNSAYQHVATITKGINEPLGEFYDGKGNLYVANVYGHNVTEYNRKRKLTFTYSAQLSGPEGVTVDASGNVYAADFHGAVVEYPQRSNTPIASCASSLENEGIALDEATGDVFVVGPNSSGSGIVEYKGGLSGCHATTLSVALNGFASGLQIDKKHNLVTGDFYTATVDIIAPPYTSITSTIEAGDPDNVALSKSNQLIFIDRYVAGDILVDDYPSGTYVTTLNSGNGILNAGAVATFPDIKD
jgi:hypothetical protein